MGGKSTKLKVKRTNGAGRPRKEGERYASGDLKRSETQKEVMAIGIEARMRVHGIYDENGYSGYVLGRLFLDKRITALEREAGDQYAAMMVRYYALTGIPAPSARAQTLFGVKGFEGDISQDRANKARMASNKMMEIEGALLGLKDGPRVKTTVYNTCVQDYDIMRTMSDLQLSWLKSGLREIHYRLGLSKDRLIA